MIKIYGKLGLFVVLVCMVGMFLGCEEGDGGGGRIGSVSNLVVHYKFDENSGTAATDSSTAENDGTITGAAWTTGKEGSALSFDGSSAYVEAAHSSTLNITSEITLMAWVKPTAVDAYARVMVKSYASDVSPWSIYSLQFDGAQHVRIEIASGDIQNVLSGTSQIQTGTWTHLACTYDGSVMKVYVNGTMENSSSLTGDIDTNTMPLSVGRSGYNKDYFNGIIDDVRVYNKALTESGINSIIQ